MKLPSLPTFRRFQKSIIRPDSCGRRAVNHFLISTQTAGFSLPFKVKIILAVHNIKGNRRSWNPPFPLWIWLPIVHYWSDLNGSEWNSTAAQIKKTLGYCVFQCFTYLHWKEQKWQLYNWFQLRRLHLLVEFCVFFNYGKRKRSSFIPPTPVSNLQWFPKHSCRIRTLL